MSAALPLATDPGARADPGDRTLPPDPLVVGTVVWLASELMFFSGLFAAWFTLRANTDRWPPSGVELATARTAAATVVLVGSSVTMHWAVSAAHRDDRQAAVRWIGVTVVMGAAFLLNQAIEYATADFHIDSHAFGSIFYLMTGFHGLHVLGGLVFLGVLAGVIGGRSRAPAGRTVEVGAAYWHFVDAVWVVMFTVVYLVR
ncbi:MAG: cytochrome c oxidase subunit [Acidimicrobiales bacterium]|nr:cytochrome c oxidase subunit [Acidimicrobiales bacterium]